MACYFKVWYKKIILSISLAYKNNFITHFEKY